MRILFVAGNTPYPPTDGWRLRTYHILRGLASRHRVTLAALAPTRMAVERLGPVQDLCETVEIVVRSPRYAVKDLVGGAIGSTPFTVRRLRSRPFELKLREMCAPGRFDVVQVEDIQMAQYATAAPGAWRVLDMHNVESVLLARYASLQGDPLRKAYARLTAWKLVAYERRHLGLFDRIFTCSEVDRDHAVRVLGAPRADVLPNGVDVERFRPRDDGEVAGALVFVGRMDYVANDDAMRYFCRDVLPLVWSAVPEARLYIVGQGPSPAVRKLAADGRVIVTGFVEDVAVYVGRASVCVAPLRYGSGTRLKILEAMAMGKPVVSTTVGCEGLGAAAEREIVVADTAPELARRIVDLLREGELRRRIGLAGRELVVRTYAWPVIVDRLLEIYEGLGEAPGAR